MHAAKAIVTLREKIGLTQRQFAERLGLSVAAISRLENGNREPSRPTLKKLAELAASAGVDYLHDVFDAQRRASIISRVEKRISAGAERHIPLADLDSWANYLRTMAALLEDSAKQLESGPLDEAARIGLRARIAGQSGTASYLLDEIQLYIGGKDAKRIQNERKERNKVYGKK